MKQKPTFKSLLVVASIFSLSAFAIVNLHATLGVDKPVINAGFVPTHIEEDEDDNERVMTVPDVTILGRLWEIAQKLIDQKN